MADRYSAARSHLQTADPVLGRLIDEHPDFDPREWLSRLPKMDAFGALLFQIVGQQLSVASTRAIIGRIEALFGERMPAPGELLEADPEALHRAGLSHRKVETMRLLARRFVDGEFSDDAFLASTDEEIEAKLTAIPGIGPWTVSGMLVLVLDRPDVFPAGDLALRRAIKRLYGLDQMPSEDEVRAMAARRRPYWSLAAAYMFESEYETPSRREAGGGPAT
jgi:DNA-3-methyladenine glycosylase II